MVLLSVQRLDPKASFPTVGEDCRIAADRTPGPVCGEGKSLYPGPDFSSDLGDQDLDRIYPDSDGFIDIFVYLGPDLLGDLGHA